MRDLHPDFKSSLESDTISLATCFRLSRLDGMVMGFTSSDIDITIDNVTYKARSGLSHTATSQSADFSSDTVDISGVLTDASITATDIQAGLYDHARIDVFLVDTQNVPETLDKTRVLFLKTAFIADIDMSGNDEFTAELKGLSDLLSRAHLNLYSPTCRVRQLGDATCNASLKNHSHIFNVQTVLSNQAFTHTDSVLEDHYFQYGTIEWKTGQNTGRTQAVKFYQTGQFTLLAPAFFEIHAGDQFKAIRGCDRQFETCRDVFDNVINFRGEPPHLLPGLDKLLDVGI